MTPNGFDYDWLVAGSGFGGSVSALRLAEKGYRVGIFFGEPGKTVPAHRRHRACLSRRRLLPGRIVCRAACAAGVREVGSKAVATPLYT
jgi:hypothetical protein